MSIEQTTKVIELAEKMIANNNELIKNLSLMKPQDQQEYFPKVMSSIEHNQKTLNNLIHAAGINQLPAVPA